MPSTGKRRPTGLRKGRPAQLPSRPGGVGRRFVEFFAGIGLVAKALEQSGWKCLYANDIDAKKKAIYDRNFATHECDLRDIWDTDGIVSQLGSPMLATASFPCVDLSLAGHWRGFKGEHSSTFFGFVRILDRLGPNPPPLIMVENVVGFLTSRGGADFVTAANALADQGYYLDAFVLDAKYFVPQSRPRVFIIGVHKTVKTGQIIHRSVDFRLADPWEESIRRQGALRPAKLVRHMESVTLSTGWVCTPIATPTPSRQPLSAVLDTGANQAWWDDEKVQKHYDTLSLLHKRQVDDLLKAKKRLITTGYRRKRNGRTRLEVRFDGIAGCLRTPRGGSARQIVVYLDRGKLKIRWMSAVEYARLQGVGDFTLLPNEREMLFGFGDAVCVPVIRWIDDCVLTPIAADICNSNKGRSAKRNK